FAKLKASAIAAATGGAALFGSTAQAVEIEYWQYFFDARVTAMADAFNLANAMGDLPVSVPLSDAARARLRRLREG
ncbi:MAG: hypothetical protein AAFX59_17215, partial [Pseudomonadota bacterium]